MGTLTFNGRLPGVVCESALPTPQENPLRLDVTALVGFAERGPLDQPVAVEDHSQYQAVFGGDLLLARQGTGGQPLYASLPTAVRTFFDNGGRRCHVVRVAGQAARANRFRLPGLVVWDADAQTFKTVIAPAASVGRWSDAMSIGTQQRRQPLALAASPLAWGEALEIHLELPAATTVLPNDLLRLEFDGQGKPILFVVSQKVNRTGNAATTTRGIPVTVEANPDAFFAFTKNRGAPPALPIQVERQQGQSWQTLSPQAQVTLLEELPALEDGYRLHLEVLSTEAVSAGDLLRLSFANGEVLLFPVIEVEEIAESSPPGMKTMLLTSREPLWQLTPIGLERLKETGWETIPATLLAPLDVLEGINRQATLHLPATEAVQSGDLLRVTCAGNLMLIFPVATTMLDQTQAEASPPEPAQMSVLSTDALWQAPAVLSPPQAPDAYGTLLEVDLLSFDLFIHEGQQTEEVWRELRFGPGTNYWVNSLVPPPPTTVAQLPDPNDPVQSLAPGLDTTRSSRLGIPLPISTAVGAVPLYLPLGMSDLPAPDEFTRALPEIEGAGSPPEPLPGKDGLDSFEDLPALFLDPRLANVGVRDLLNEANQLLYFNPAAQVEPLRKLHSLLLIDEVGLISIPDLIHRRWDFVAPIEETPEPPPEPPPPDWSCFQQCSEPPAEGGLPQRSLCADPLPFSSPPPGVDLPDLRQQLNALPVLEPPGDYRMDELLRVQGALVNFCAARADVLAVLGLPQHFKASDVLEWHRRFTTGRPDFLESAALSYTAVYHPWLQIPEAATPELAPLRAIPPDGAVCGMIAARELARGPWIAPANMPLLGVVGLTPVLAKSDWVALFNAAVNVVRQVPGKFTLLSAHTLSLDSLLVQISVRRLLIFLRKLALRRGMRYVFEVNNERFRQRVQASFERTLSMMVVQGAINAFEVDTGSEINTPNDYDNGRFLIALKIAPTLPIEFITVVLLRTGESLLEVVER